MSQKIELKNGNGGIHMQSLIRELLAEFTVAPNTQVDAATFLTLPDQQWLTTTDGFSVEPLFFPGGSIGSLAVNGTVNDLAVSGAVAKFLTLNLFIEEGFALNELKEIMADLARAADNAKVQIIAGDTKVLPHGQLPGVLMATTGIGVKMNPMPLGFSTIQPGDAILTSGSLGDHGAAVMLAREAFGLTGDVQSCCAPVTDLAQAAMNYSGLRFMRDPTRGGLVTVLHDLANDTQLSPRIIETALPIKPQVNAICDILGYNPLVLASEGRIVAVIDAAQADSLLNTWQAMPGGKEAAIIGTVGDTNDDPVMITELGGEKYIAPLQDDPLPRIC